MGFLQQNAFHRNDTYVPLPKQLLMMRAILHLHHKAKEIIAQSIPLARVIERGLFEKLVRMKYEIPNDELFKFDEYTAEIDSVMDEILAQAQL